MENQDILEVRLVKEALAEILKENLFMDVNEFASREKYISWQLSKIFVFPVFINIHVTSQPSTMQALFTANGVQHSIDYTIN